MEFRQIVILVISFLAKVAQIFGGSLAYFGKMKLKVNSGVATFGKDGLLFLLKIGQLFRYRLPCELSQGKISIIKL